MKGICILGATGSIGISTLDVVARHPQNYRVVALTANNNVALLYEQCLRHKPEYVVLASENKAEEFKRIIAGTPVDSVNVMAGPEALQFVATLDAVDSVMAAIVGSAGLLPTLAAAKSGKTVLLANKEALVMSGQLLLQAVKKSGATLLPIDSEHNAIFQCMPGGYVAGHTAKAVRRILLTASGGPFRQTPVEELPGVTPDQAIAHPKWDMGKKISVDSATMMNKGLELIEACLLFEMPPENIQVVIHPQSIIHSMVDYVDGSVLAQMGNPDMRTPIAHALAWPERFGSGVEALDVFKVGHLDFEEPDLQRFPCLGLAYRAVKAGGIMPTVLNAANEVAVAAFLEGSIRFTDIAKVIAYTMDGFAPESAESLEVVLHVDRQSRDLARIVMTRLTG